MKYIPPQGGAPDDAYVNHNINEGVEGSIPLAEAFEHPQREIVNAIIAAGMTPDGNDLTQLSQILQNISGETTGKIGYFAMATPPAGWLEANGASLLRADYQPLFDAIGTHWGSVDGDHFSLPDLRGEFVRGLDNGRGIDTARTLGDPQLDALQNIKATWHTDKNGSTPAPTGAIHEPNAPAVYKGPGGSSDLSVTYEFDASREVRTANETRPRNIALLACIKT